MSLTLGSVVNLVQPGTPKSSISVSGRQAGPVTKHGYIILYVAYVVMISAEALEAEIGERFT